MAQPVLAQEESLAGVRRLTEKSLPVYPELARRLSLEGVVKLRVTVAPDGAVKQSEVLGGNPVLAKAAQDAVRKWRWAAAAQETKEEVQLNFHPK
jgi:TonB family protein